MRFDYSKLKGRMAEKGYSQKELAGRVGISENTMSKKLLRGEGFRPSIINAICEVLDIREKEIGMYFFTPMFNETEQFD